MNIDHTPKELAAAIKLAHSLKLSVVVTRYPEVTCIDIEGLPIGCGFGMVDIRLPKSHRRADKLRTLGANWMWSSLNYKTFYYQINNDPWTIAQAEKLGASVMKSKVIKTRYKIASQAQKEWYDKNIMKR